MNQEIAEVLGTILANLKTKVALEQAQETSSENLPDKLLHNSKAIAFNEAILVVCDVGLKSLEHHPS